MRITGFYGNPDTNLRSEAWSMLRRIRRRDNEPWLCLGDFNELLWVKERRQTKNEMANESFSRSA